MNQRRIGEALVAMGFMTEFQKERVLEIQKKEKEKLFGEIAEELGYIDIDSLICYLVIEKKR